MNFPRILKKRKGYIDRIKPFMQKSVAKEKRVQSPPLADIILYLEIGVSQSDVPIFQKKILGVTIVNKSARLSLE